MFPITTPALPPKLEGLMHRTAVRFSPNHEEDDAPTPIFDHFYKTDSRAPGAPGFPRGSVYTRALFWLVWDCTDEAGADGGPWCLQVPFRAWLSPTDGTWRISDHTIPRTISLLWEQFGFVCY